MTRINTIHPKYLLDQHLMAEYREFPMVEAALRKSLDAKNPIDIPDTYRLGTGHVKFFYNKKQYLMNRYDDLIKELLHRGYDINPWSRDVDFSTFDQVDQVDWEPAEVDHFTNINRILMRFSENIDFYTYYGKHLKFDEYYNILKDEI